MKFSTLVYIKLSWLWETDLGWNFLKTGSQKFQFFLGKKIKKKMAHRRVSFFVGTNGPTDMERLSALSKQK
jgi:hypothetical protein